MNRKFSYWENDDVWFISYPGGYKTICRIIKESKLIHFSNPVYLEAIELAEILDFVNNL